MARQHGIIKINGTIDDLSFYKTQDGYMVKKKTTINGARIATDANFIRTRENGVEFGSAATDGKLLREALRSNLLVAADNRVTPRLTQLMRKILKEDPTSARGLRTVGNAITLPSAMTLLKGFNFNKHALMGSVMHGIYTVNAATGVISFASLTPANDIVAPQGATHFSLLCSWAKVDFTGKTYNVQYSNVVNMAINAAPAAVALTPPAAPTGTGTNVLLLQVEFFQIVNSIQYTLNNGAYNALEVVSVS